VIENGVQTVPGNIDKEDYATLRIGQKFTHKVSTTTRIWETVEFVPQVSDFENYVLTAELGIETSISKSMSLRISLVDIYRNQPPAGREQNDLRLVAGVQYKF
jgi:putative salt-induced outer membrane protein YdiY